MSAPKKPDAGTASKSPASATQRIEREGIAVDFSLVATPSGDGKPGTLVAGADAVATFRVTDARTGQPVVGLHPNAWFSSRLASAEPTTEAQCKDKIRTFMGGLLSARADLDLNSYLLVSLNHDRTLTFTNPQISFSKTKLESIIPLPSNGADFVLNKTKDRLFVTLPEQSAVLVIDTIARKIIETVNIEGKHKPMRIALEPDGSHVWVGLDESPLVAVIDTATGKLSRTVSVGAGLHNIAFTADSRFAYVTNSAADTVSAIDTKTLAKVADIAVGKTPVPLAFSTASGHVYVASLNGGSVAAIDPAKQTVAATIPLTRGVVALGFEPRGRFALAVNQLDSTVTVIDTATNKLVGGTPVVKSPDQVSFTSRYAYVRGTGSEKFSLVELDKLGRGEKVTAVDVQAGQRPPSEMPAELGVASMIVPTPEGNSVMIAHAPDQMIYFYVEGMMAPMGTLSNYKRRPRGILLLDRSLTEIAPGTYSTPVKLGRSGSFDVPVLINETKIAHCFQASVGKSPNGPANEEKSTIVVAAAFAGKEFKSGAGVPLKLKLTDSITGQPIVGLGDVQVLVFEPPGVWQQRQWAKEVGAGEYEITQVFPHAGIFNVMVRVGSRGVSFADLPFTPVNVKDGDTAAQKPE